MTDNIEHPSYYQGKYDMETIDVIRNYTGGMSGIEGYYTGRIFEYICRWYKKDGLEDLQKAQVCLRKLIAEVKVKSKMTDWSEY